LSEGSALGPAPDRHLADPAAVDIAGIVEAHSFSVAISALGVGMKDVTLPSLALPMRVPVVNPGLLFWFD